MSKSTIKIFIPIVLYILLFIMIPNIIISLTIMASPLIIVYLLLMYFHKKIYKKKQDSLEKFIKENDTKFRKYRKYKTQLQHRIQTIIKQDPSKTSEFPSLSIQVKYPDKASLTEPLLKQFFAHYKALHLTPFDQF